MLTVKIPVIGTKEWFYLLATCFVLGVPSAGVAELDRVFPQLATVTGVSAGDTLNIRSESRGSSADIGDLQPSSTVEVLEVEQTGKWARILHEEGSGWIAARFLNATPYKTTHAGVPLGLMCIGTEPFWSLSLNTDQTLTFEQPSFGRRTLNSTWSTRSVNSGGAVYGIANQDVQAILRRASCSDGMSDRIYGWEVDVLTNGAEQPTLLSGCCFAQVN